MNKKGDIGVFDSGFGGLIILREIVKELPEYNYIYLGDTARTPYGSRSREVIYEFTKQAVDFLFGQGCNLIILACNTASSDVLRKIQQEYLPSKYPDKKVLGVLIPASEYAIKKTKNGRVGVIATEGTVKSGSFIREFKKLNPEIEVFQQACPLLVPIIETGEWELEETKLILEKYLAPLKKQGVDTVILGCTHYGILKKEIEKILGPDVTVITEEEVVPTSLRDYLRGHGDIELNKERQIKFYSTDITDKFANLGSEFFGEEISVDKASL